MNRVYIETDKRKFYLSYADVSITYNIDIIIGFKKSVTSFDYYEEEKIYKKIYDYDLET